MVKENKTYEEAARTMYELSSDEYVREQCRRREEYYRQIRTYEKNLADKDAKIAKQSAQIADMEAKIADLMAQLKESDSKPFDMVAHTIQIFWLLAAYSAPFYRVHFCVYSPSFYST